MAKGPATMPPCRSGTPYFGGWSTQHGAVHSGYGTTRCAGGASQLRIGSLTSVTSGCARLAPPSQVGLAALEPLRAPQRLGDQDQGHLFLAAALGDEPAQEVADPPGSAVADRVAGLAGLPGDEVLGSGRRVRIGHVSSALS